jgi:3-phosphoshikimate 1-carboxyvinyltransferase
MGGDIEVLDVGPSGGEPVADLRVRHSELKGVSVPPERAPSMIECYPALAIAASFAHGTTTMAGLGALRSGPSDRLAAMARGLRRNGVVCTEGEDVLAVEGSGRVMGGGRVVTGMDHRIATSFLVMGMAADDAVTIDDQSALALGFADFVASFEDVGASFIRYSE